MSPEELKEYFAGVVDIVPPTVEYRLHYNELGEIYLCTMVNHPNSTNYIVVDQTTYDQYYMYRIVDKKLKKIDNDSGYRVKLKKSDHGYCVVKNHAGLLLEAEEAYNNIEYYEYRNN